MKKVLKIPILLSCLIFVGLRANAYVPILPLSYKLETRNKAIMEGDKVEFVLTIKNNHETKTFPILTPGTQNAGKKLIYLRVSDPATNFYVLRTMESRDIRMNNKQKGALGMVWLKPGQELSISFFWNDSVNYATSIRSHHSFDKPLFAGKYEFQAFYDPSGTGTGDTLYHYMRSTHEQPSQKKLTFFGPGISGPYSITIGKRQPGSFKVDGVKYSSPQPLREGAFSYYAGTVNDSNLVAVINTIPPNGIPLLEVRIKRYNNTEWLKHSADGDIEKYALIDYKRCPTEYYAREYMNNILVVKTDTTPDGSVTRKIYNEDGTLKFKELYSMPDLTHTSTEYIYKDKVLKKEKTKTEKFKVPCEILVEDIVIN